MQLLNTALLNTAALLNTVVRKRVAQYGTCCLLALTVPGIIFAQDRARPDQATLPISQVATASPQDEAALSNLPDSPGAAWAKEKEKEQDSSRQQESDLPSPSTSAQTGPSEAASSPSATSQDAAAQDQSQKPQRPVGTAAAEAPKVNGITAAQPAGVAIAPARHQAQRAVQP